MKKSINVSKHDQTYIVLRGLVSSPCSLSTVFWARLLLNEQTRQVNKETTRAIVTTEIERIFKSVCE